MRVFIDGGSDILASELLTLGAVCTGKPETADLIYRVGVFRNAKRTVSVLTAEGGGTRAWPFRIAEEIMRSRVIDLKTDSFLRLGRPTGDGSPAVITDMLFIGPDGSDVQTVMWDTARVIASFAGKTAD